MNTAAVTSRAVDHRRAEFQARGWIVLRGVVSASDLAELNALFDERTAPSAAGVRPSKNGVTLRSGGCRGPGRMLRHLYDGVAEVVCDLLGAPSIHLLQDALLLKPPSTPASIALHQDYTYTGFLDPPALASVGLALNDASVESGCLYVIDASHTWGLLGDLRIFAGKLQTDCAQMLSPAQREAVERHRIPLEVQAGDVTIHHCLTLHGSDENRSARARKTIVTHLFSGECRLIRDRLPPAAQLQFAANDDGHLTGPQFPILYPPDRSIEPDADRQTMTESG